MEFFEDVFNEVNRLLVGIPRVEEVGLSVVAAMNIDKDAVTFVKNGGNSKCGATP
jgi:hypothetical protein